MFPEVHINWSDDGELVIMMEEDRQRILVWIAQVERIHESLEFCDQIEWVPESVILP